MTPVFVRSSLVLCLTAFFTPLGCAPALTAPANSLRELFADFGACMKGVAGDPGEELTIAFSLKRDGSLLGRPHIAFSKLNSDAAEQGRLVDSVATKFAACLPAPITDALGGAIAGRRLVIRFVIPRKEISS